MNRMMIAALCAALFVVGASPATSATDALTLEGALAIARERAPRLLSAAARIDESRGRLAGASPLLQENPVLDTGAGRRFSDQGDTLEASAGIRQNFELGGQRRARIAGAEAGVERATAARENALRRLLREIARAFCRGLYATERLGVAATSEEIAAEVARIADNRHRAEDVPILDVNVSRAALARARAEREAVEAERASIFGELRILLGMEASEPLELAGDLRDRRQLDRKGLLTRAARRADLRALEAKLAEAEAELRLARAEAWPDLGLGARYERDERDDIVVGELSLTLPVFDRAQGARAEASARVRRLRVELDAARRAADVELQTALTVHARRANAVEELEANALPLLDENESLARRSYEAGQMPLAELLLVRRETLDTRREYLERLLETAVAAIDVEASAGALE
jgi:cobalt-zinc-cadmium efflux system outer membrane protein